MPRLGQHFLTSDHHLQKVVEAAEIEPDDRILEIGPGTGRLTRRLLDAGARVVAIELDRHLADELQARLGDPTPGEFHLLQGDAVETDWPRFDKLVSNLPYQISSPVLFRLLDEDYALAVLTLQREFAERLVASPGTKAYSRLTVKTSLRARAELLFGIPPGAFSPPPEVDSACVRLVPVEPPDVLDWALLDELVDQAFTMRRKMVRNSVARIEGAAAIAAAMGLDEKRPGNLSPDQWVELANQVVRVRGED